MPHTTITLSFHGTVTITHDIDPNTPTDKLLEIAKQLLDQGIFAPDDIKLNIENIDKPSSVSKNGTKYWKNDKDQLHRTDGPAIIFSDGSEWHYQNGKLHRDNGPAVILSSGTMRYYQNGLLHRIDGPAVILPTGKESYYLNNQCLSKQEWQNQLRPKRKKGWFHILERFTYDQ